MSAYTKLAKDTLENYVKTGQIVIPPVDEEPEEFKEKKSCFVSLKKDGQLRGCIGTLQPYRDNLEEEIVMNAVSAGTRDPRFPAITVDELPEIQYSVDVLSEPEPITSLEGHDVKKQGLIVSTRDGRSGVLLPDLDGVNTPEEQLLICLQKGGIYPGEEVSLETFTVERHGEDDE